MHSDKAEVIEFLAGLTPVERTALFADWPVWARIEQLPPDGDWTTWVFLGGRGAGKTRAGAEWVRGMALGLHPFSRRPAGRIALVGETYMDVREVMVEGVSGLMAVHPPGEKPEFQVSRRRVVWPNGAVAQLFSSEDPEGLRGPQFDAAWCDEFGFPAIDRGANQPNVFLDAKSSENAAPYFSTASRDDVLQRRALEVVIDHWTANAPISGVYGGAMIPADRMYAWTWDARSFPAWPADTTLWADALNWDRGHWLNGRLGTAPVDDLVTAIMAEFPAPSVTVTGTAPAVDGYIIDRVMSARDALSPLEHAFAVDILESGGGLVLASRLSATVASFNAEELARLADEPDTADLVVRRGQETELPAIARISFSEPFESYRQITVEARMPDVLSDRVATSTLPAVLSPEAALQRAEEWLHAIRTRRETARFSLPPSELALEPGDIVAVTGNGGAREWRIEEISDDGRRIVDAVAADRAPYNPAAIGRRRPVSTATALSGEPLFEFLDLPLLTDAAADTTLYFAAHAIPWEQGIAVYRSPTANGFVLETVVETPAIIGTTQTPLGPGPVGVWDEANTVDVAISSGSLSSLDDLLVFGGANALAIATGAGWEILQFANAALIGTRTYRLSRLLRGQLGSDRLLGGTVAAGARMVVLDADLAALALSSDKVGVAANWRVGLAGRAFDHPSFTDVVFSPAGEGLRPLSPVHLRAVWQSSSGDIVLTWIRRTRRGGDSWETADVPLAEETEAYDLVIRNGGGIVREVSATVPAFTYTTAQQAADFGAALAPGDTLDLEVFQRSATFGRGAGERRVLNV